MKRIYSYVIEQYFNNKWIFCTGYKTLPTMRKRFNLMREHGIIKIRLVARDYDRNVIKVYEEVL